MRTVSNGFIEASLSPTGYATAYIMIGSTRIDASNLTDITITEDLGGGAFNIGALNTTEVSITVVSEAIEGLDLTQAIQVYLGYLVEDDFEYVPMGTFYAEPRDISHKNLLTVIRARDLSWTLTSPYVSALDFSSSVYVSNILSEIQTDLGIVYGTYGGLNPQYVRVYEAPEGSYRDVLAQMALLLGTNAKFNRSGALDFIKTDPSLTPVQSYGAFDYASADYVLTSDEPMTVGKLTVNYTYTEGEEEVTDTYVYGSGAHGVTIDTVNIRSQSETDSLGLEAIGSGVSYYGYSVVLPGQPQLDLADVISLTEPLGDQYNFIVLSMVHNFNGAMRTTLSAQIDMEDLAIDGQNINGSIKDTVIAEKKRLNQVERIAGNTNQYFWHTETGTDTGAHITEVPKDDFIADPQNGGGNLLARTNGIAIRDGLEELATFGANQVTIGESGLQSIITSRTLSQVYGDIATMRLGITNDAEGLAVIVSTVVAGDTTSHTVNNRIVEMISALYDDGTAVSYSVSEDGKTITINNRDTTQGITFRYKSDTACGWFIFGTRASGLNGFYSLSQGFNHLTSGGYSSAFGRSNISSGSYTHTAGRNNTASGECSVAFGYDTVSSGYDSFSGGYQTEASGNYSHAEGHSSIASGEVAHAEGVRATASGAYSHAEGWDTTASGMNSHTEGRNTTASGEYSHAEGYGTTASGRYSHAEGGQGIKYNITQTPTANGVCSHAEGGGTTADGDHSHSEGFFAHAKGWASHSQNESTIANYSQTAIGRYNVESGSVNSYVSTDNAFIIGNGTSDSNRSNALAVSWDGNMHLNGDVYVGCNADSSGGVALSKNLVVQNVELVDNSTVTHASYGNGSKSIAKTGYTPLGIVGMHIENATTSGTYNTWCLLHSYYLSGNTAYYIVRNTHASTDAKIKITASILYVAN